MRDIRLVLSVVVFATPSVAEAQSWKEIRDEQCRECRIQIEKLVQLGSEIDGGYVSLPSNVVPWQGGWAVTHSAKPHSVALYQSDGRFVRDVGRRGDAEGEYRLAGRMYAALDSLYIADHELLRLNVYTPDMTVARIVRLPSADVGALYPLAHGQVLINSQIRSSAVFGFPLHVLSLDGSIVRSFGADTPSVNPQQRHAHLRVLSAPKNGAFWMARRTDYVLERWDVTGKKLAEWRRRTDWFPTHGRGGMRSRTEPPNPSIQALWVDDDNRAWVIISVADPNWAGAVDHSAGSFQGIPRNKYTDHNDYFDTVIEVIDLDKGVLLARARMDNQAVYASGDGRIVTYLEADDGTQLIEVWRPRLVRRRP